MKKKRLYLLVLISIISLFGFTQNVFAADKEDAYSGKLVMKNYGFNGKTSVNTGVLARPCGNGLDGCKRGSSEQAITASNSYIRINGHDYKAWCVDPALSARSGFNYMCTPMNANSGLNGLFNACEGAENNESKEVQCSFAFRFYAVYSDIGMTATDAAGHIVSHSGLTARKAAMIRYLQALDGHTDSTQFLKPNNSTAAANLATGLSLAQTARGAGAGTAGDNFASLKYRRGPSTSTTVTYTVTSPVDIPGGVTFTCDNCAGISATSTGTRTWTVTVTQLSEKECSYTIYADFGITGLYSCYAGEGRQLLLIKIDNPEDAKIPFKDKNPRCGQPDCCPEEIPEKEVVVENCCLNETESYIKEPALNDLFCEDPELAIPHYWAKCNAEYYLENDYPVNDYCDLYCTERVYIEIPGTITAVSGRYFTLSTTAHHGTTSPFVEGFKRCRMIVYFDKWYKEYFDDIKQEVKQYNKYQKNQAFEETYEKLLATKQSNYEDPFTIKCTSHVEAADCIDPVAPATDKTGGCSADDSAEISCKFVYDRYTKNDNMLLKYEQIKIYNLSGDESYSDRWESIQFRHEDTLKDDWHDINNQPWVAQKNDNIKKDCKDKLRAKAETQGVQCTASAACGGTVTGTWSCEIVGEADFDAHVFDVEGIYQGYVDASATAESSFREYASDAKIKEEEIDDCDNFFHKDGVAPDPEEFYNFHPSISFRYSQIYRADTGEAVLDETDIPFKETPGCIIEGPEEGATEEDTEGPVYSTRVKYFEGIMPSTDFASVTLHRCESCFTGFLDETYPVDKVFRHDARYHASCSWDEEDDNINTLVPDGVASQAEETNMTIHNKEYRVFLTTFEGQFETDWGMTGVGEDGKFDNDIIEGKTTCAGNSATPTEAFSCTLKVEYEIIYVGTCNPPELTPTKNPDDCDPVSQVSPLFEFKVVDPKDLFPQGTSTADGRDIAYNWTHRDKGIEVRDIMEDKGVADTTYARENESYSFFLNGATMRHIKNYNISKNANGAGGYTDFDLVCDCPSDPGSPTHGYVPGDRDQYACIKCRSDFIEKLYGGNIRYNNVDHEVDAWRADRTLQAARTKTFWR